MSGIGGRVVDPVAALLSEPAATLPAVPEVPPVPSAHLVCGSGHPVAAGAKFCGECGQPLSRHPAVPDGPPAALNPPADPRPKPEHLLTPEERAERQRKHLLALEAGKRDPGIQSYAQPQPGQETVLIHMVEDGLTAFGQVWFRGQELEIVVGGPRWDEAAKWILLDDGQQMARWKKIMFRRGPWPGLRTYQAARFEPLKALSGDGVLTPVDMTALQQADAAEARRGRGVPVAAGF